MDLNGLFALFGLFDLFDSFVITSRFQNIPWRRKEDLEKT